VKSPVEHRIAYFISPHGFGHAARAAAVMEAVYQKNSAVRFEIFTQVPIWFFEKSLSGAFDYHPLLTDIGLVQKDSLVEDLPETVRRLGDFLPFDPGLLQNLAEQITNLNCDLIICDIAPLGIAVARTAKIPSVLIENFTWDWIYQGYLPYDERLAKHSTYLQGLFQAADYHIQTEPICQQSPQADLTTPPISRRLKTPAHQIRQQLDFSEQAKIILLTMGGVPWEYKFLEQLENQDQFHFVIPNGSNRQEIRKNLLLLPNHSSFFHPDLINAADVVIGKAGYSTLAEVYQAGVPFGYIPRPRFRETQFLTEYIAGQMTGVAITDTQFQDGSWLEILPDLLTMPRTKRRDSDGADQVAHFILERVL
jgi:uncharacterized protein (TIGR00661 family)